MTPPAIHELLIVGALIVAGMLGGRLLGRLRVPTVTSYLLLGLLAGPSVLGILTEETLRDLQPVRDIALGLIMFHVGGQLDLSRQARARLRLALRLGAVEALVTFGVLLVALHLAGAPPALALAAAVLCCSSSPAVILMVVRQFGTKGPLTDALLSASAVDNVISFALFALVLPFLHASAGMSGPEVLLQPVYLLAGSGAAGAAAGYALGKLEDRLPEEDHTTLQIGFLILVLGAARSLQLSPLAAALALGSAAASTARSRSALTDFGRGVEQPFFLLLFLLAGARLHLHELADAGILGLVLVGARVGAKMLGGLVGGLVTGQQLRTSALLGVGLSPLAGMAIGLTGLLSSMHPQLGASTGALVLAAIAVFETIGPPLTELAMIRAGEVQSGLVKRH